MTHMVLECFGGLGSGATRRVSDFVCLRRPSPRERLEYPFRAGLELRRRVLFFLSWNLFFPGLWGCVKKSDGDLLDSVCFLVLLRRFDDGDDKFENLKVSAPIKVQ